MVTFHTPTVFLTLSFLYVTMPVAVWLAVSNQSSKTIKWWCVGGEILAIGLFLFGMRPYLPDWVSYPLANTFTWVGILMQVQALQRELKIESHPKWMALLVVFFLAVFEYFRTGLENQHLRFTWGLLIFMMIFAYISFLAFKIGRAHELRSARLMSMVYGIASVVLYVRIMRVHYGFTEPDVVAQGLDSLLIVFSGFLCAVFGSFSFVGMFLEQIKKKELLAIEDRTRQEEGARLADEIAQLERQRTLGLMSYSFAHEFSQPLTAILMDAYSAKSHLMHGQVDVSAAGEAIEGIERNANRTRELVERIRNFILPSHQDFEKVDMKELVQDVKHLLAHDIRHQGIEFKWEIEDDVCVVLGDKVQLSQILLNIYRNAIQAMAKTDGRKVFVSVGRLDDRVVVRVRDTGEGLAQELRHTIGMPFVTTKVDGMGVGLSISKSIAEKHSGSLTLANAIGGGALAELNLPANSA